MAYTLTNLRDDIRNYTEVGSNVLTDAVLETIIKNAENKIFFNLSNFLFFLFFVLKISTT